MVRTQAKGVFPVEAWVPQVNEALRGAQDGELFAESCHSETLVLDDRRLKTAEDRVSSGFGLRAVAGEATGYAHSCEVSQAALRRAAETVGAVKHGYTGSMSVSPARGNKAFYGDEGLSGSSEGRIGLLREMDAYARAKDAAVRQVAISLSCVRQEVVILRVDGEVFRDVRPLTRLFVQVVAGRGQRQEIGMSGTGGRVAPEQVCCDWKGVVDEALRQALVNLEAVPAPMGEMPVALGPGWPGILLHEAIGHGLEGDFNRKGTSAFSGLMGEQVAARGITVVDDGTLDKRRGSVSMDDEGTPGQRTVLIEDGILKGYLQDRLNGRLMGMAPTGNGRRQSYAHSPMPRMTNTFMLNGTHTREEMIASMKRGIYAVSFGGGQVDITSGKFVFSCTEAYRVENGRLGAPLKGAMLIGHGPEVLRRVSLVGNDFSLDPGIGTCGKDGQLVPVGVGQPSLLIDALTVGGTG